MQANLRTPQEVAQATVEQVAKIFESASRDAQPHHKSVLLANARKVVQGAKRLMQERLQEQLEEHQALLKAIGPRLSQAVSSSQSDLGSQSQQQVCVSPMTLMSSARTAQPSTPSFSFSSCRPVLWREMLNCI
jgi:hypothetical protein